jgi:glutathione S-transferase
MKLYYAPGACSLASHIVAEEEGLPLDLERVDLKTHRTARGEDFYAINPKGYVPTLGFDGGEILTENVAILPFLADLAPAAELAPADGTMDRVRLLEWLGFLNSELHHAFAPFFHGNDENRGTEARGTIRKRLSFIADRIGGHDYLMGDKFTVADAYLFVMLRWCDMAGIDLGEFPVLDRYRARIAARPPVQAAMKAEGLPLDRPAAMRRRA